MRRPPGTQKDNIPQKSTFDLDSRKDRFTINGSCQFQGKNFPFLDGVDCDPAKDIPYEEPRAFVDINCGDLPVCVTEVTLGLHILEAVEGRVFRNLGETVADYYLRSRTSRQSFIISFLIQELLRIGHVFGHVDTRLKGRRGKDMDLDDA